MRDDLYQTTGVIDFQKAKLLLALKNQGIRMVQDSTGGIRVWIRLPDRERR